MTYTIHVGDCRETLQRLPAGSVQCVVTSPPYFGLRSYLPAEHPDKALEIGSETTPAEFVQALVEVFREVRRVLRDDGTVWLNLGDSYARNGGEQGGGNRELLHLEGKQKRMGAVPDGSGLKPKDLIGVPWMVAFALREDGWYLRSEIIWHKPSPMPESVTDRPTKAHEQVFLLTKRPTYFYDAEAVKEESITNDPRRPYTSDGAKQIDGREEWKSGQTRDGEDFSKRNRRSVWTIASQPFAGSHFATMPPKLVEPCILAGTSEEGCCPACGSPWRRVVEKRQITRERPNDFVKRNGEDGTGNSCANTVAGVEVKTLGWEPTCRCNAGAAVPCTVLDPFNGAGTTGLVAVRFGRNYVGCELSAEYAEMAKERIREEADKTGLFR